MTFDPKSDSKATFSGQKVTFGVTFRVTLGETPKVQFFELQSWPKFLQQNFLRTFYFVIIFVIITKNKSTR